MTKPRPPLSYENALDRIVERLGIKAVARIGRVAERTVHDWTDPDSPRSAPIAVALLLDRAWRDAGGDGFPLFDTYRRLIECAAPAPPLDLAMHLPLVIRECAEAKTAFFLATLPSATGQCRMNAVREIEQGIDVLSATLPHLLPAQLTPGPAPPS